MRDERQLMVTPVPFYAVTLAGDGLRFSGLLSSGQSLVRLQGDQHGSSIAERKAEVLLSLHTTYMPALVALRREHHQRTFYQRLVNRGKARLQAVVAVMRKLSPEPFGGLAIAEVYGLGADIVMKSLS